MNPCGHAVDCIRSCYEADVKFFHDSPDLERIVWYFVPDDAPTLPFAHPFASRVWDIRNEEDEPELGERYANRKYVKGKNPTGTRKRGLCGTPEQWRDGASVDDPAPPTWPGTDVPKCCPKPGSWPLLACGCPGCPDPCGCNQVT